MNAISSEFEKYCRAVASDFLQTVVIVDNQPEPTRISAPGLAKRTRPASPSNKKAEEKKHENPVTGSEAKGVSHELDYRKVANAFAARGLTCGSYYPDEQKVGREKIVETSVQVSRYADVAILDWQLESGDPTAAIEVVRRLLDEDRGVGGRLRLITIYTAETPLEDQVKKLKSELSEYELVEANPLTLEDDNCRIRFFNKPTIGSEYVADDNVVAWDKLPDRVEQEFADFAKGLLRAFSLKAIASIRTDTHRILAQFPIELDGAFAGHRASLPDPDDAGRLMKEVILSEISNSIEAMGVPSETLGKAVVFKWLSSQSKFYSTKAKLQFDPRPGSLTYEDDGDTLVINGEARKYLLEMGLSNRKNGRPDPIMKIFPAFYPTKGESDQAQRRFSMLTSLVSHPGRGGDQVPAQTPVLTLGVLLEEAKEDGSSGSRLLCLQPRCDSVRLSKERGFLMVELEKDGGKFDLIMMDGDEPASFRLNHKDPKLKTMMFKPSKTQKVVVAEKANGVWIFNDSDNRKWRWIGEVREIQVLSFLAKVTGNFNRVGVNQSEWLRLQSS